MTIANAITAGETAPAAGTDAPVIRLDHHRHYHRGLDHALLQVRDFHQDFGHPVGKIPQMLDRDRVKTRAKWTCSEIQEFEDADTLVDQVDANLDAIYFCLGSLVEMGVMPQSLFDIVHYQGNMAKKHLIDGELVVVKRDDGKVVKPEGWVAPEPMLQEEIDRQARIASEC